MRARHAGECAAGHPPANSEVHSKQPAVMPYFPLSASFTHKLSGMWLPLSYYQRQVLGKYCWDKRHYRNWPCGFDRRDLLELALTAFHASLSLTQR